MLTESSEESKRLGRVLEPLRGGNSFLHVIRLTFESSSVKKDFDTFF